MRFVIIGDGPAGHSAIDAILKIEPSASIQVFTEEAFPFYARVKLTEYLDDRVSLEGLVLRKPEWYAGKNVELHLEERVQSIDPLKKIVETEKGSYPFDRLLIATGASAFMPPIPGSELPGVQVLRSIRDADSLKKKASVAKHGVIIGGGVLGLEAAASLVSLNPELELTVVDTSPQLLSRQLDETGARLLQAFLEQKRIAFLLQAKTLRFEGKDEVEKVILERGENLEIPADFVLVSAGVRSRIELAEKTGILCGRGISVNENLQTNFPDIFAAGDCAEFEGVCYGLWKPAMDQGAIAGKNMAGQQANYPGFVLSSKLKIAGIEIASVGDFDPSNKMRASIEEGDSLYSKVVYDGDGLIVGGILVGDVSSYPSLVKAVADKARIEDWQGSKKWRPFRNETAVPTVLGFRARGR